MSMDFESPEEWRPVAGYEGYEVSNRGHIRSIGRYVPYSDHRRRWHPSVTLKPGVHRSGHLIVRIHNKTTSIHRLVAAAFLGESDLLVCHKNGIPTDNRVENLYYGTHSDNLRDSVRHGVHGGVKKTHCPHGHEYTPENVYMCGKNGTSRRCRTCAIDQATKRNKDLGKARRR